MLSSSVWRGKSQSWFIGGLLVGAMASSMLIATLGSLLLRPILPGSVSFLVVASVALVTVAREIGLLRLSLPQNARQVPERISAAGPRYGALQFGFEMGTGMRTYMTSSSPYLLLTCVALLASVPEILIAGIGFGLGRAAMTGSRNTSPDPLVWDAQLAQSDRAIRVALAVAAAGAGSVLAWYA